ncbi:MAG: hypothetical protein GC162_21030 [Planctomycetes bacterium]|nr:hypothetical protein [Planctomycetota bacterium]
MLLFATVLAGCPRPTPQTDALPAAAPTSEVDESIDRFVQILPWVFEDIHWGWARPRTSDTMLTVSCVLPDGRDATVVCTKNDTGKLTARVRVLPFGDEAAETEFLAALQKRVAFWRGKKVR